MPSLLCTGITLATTTLSGQEISQLTQVVATPQPAAAAAAAATATVQVTATSVGQYLSFRLSIL